MDLGLISGGPTAARPLFRVEDDIEGGILSARWIRHWVPALSTQLDLGVTGLGDVADATVLIGGAVRWNIGNTGPIAYAAQVGLSYLPGRDVDVTGVSSDGFALTGVEEFDVFEYGGAFLASMVIAQNDHARSTVYTGPRVSALRGDYSAVIDAPVAGTRMWVDGDIEETQPFGWVLGVHADCNGRVNFRVEGRVVDEASLSIGSSIAF